MCRLGTAHPLCDTVHPVGGSGEGGMDAVGSARDAQVVAVVETCGTHVLPDHRSYARVAADGAQRDRANPDEGAVADDAHDFLHSFSACADVVVAQVVGAEAHDDECGVYLLHEPWQFGGVCPVLGGGTIPDRGIEGVAVGAGIVVEASSHAVEHRVAEEENAVVGGVFCLLGGGCCRCDGAVGAYDTVEDVLCP